VLLTAMGKRQAPAAAEHLDGDGQQYGIGKQLWDYGVRVLEGAQEDDRSSR
jgi:hypothetical protein